MPSSLQVLKLSDPRQTDRQAEWFLVLHFATKNYCFDIWQTFFLSSCLSVFCLIICLFFFVIIWITNVQIGNVIFFAHDFFNTMHYFNARKNRQSLLRHLKFYPLSEFKESIKSQSASNLPRWKPLCKTDRISRC